MMHANDRQMYIKLRLRCITRISTIIIRLIIIVMLSRISRAMLARFCSHAIEPSVEHYEKFRKVQFEACLSSVVNQYIEGHCTVEGVTNFASKHPQIMMKSLISPGTKLSVSSIGVGTYKGSLDARDDILQFNAIIDSVLSGVNCIDTCSNFRGGRSEFVVGLALRYLVEHKKYNRDQILIGTKAGYVRQKLSEDLQKEVVNDHCVHPIYLEHSLNKSLEALKLKTVDIFYLNNFAECQIEGIGKDKFQERLSKAFQFCQKSIAQGKIKNYGLASWQSFRVSPKHAAYLNLNSVLKVAKKVGGENHGFRFLQVPINIMMPEAFAQKNQQYGSLLETAEHLKINVISCSPLLNGTLINVPLPTNKLSCRHNGAKHLQLLRSIPSPSLVSTLIGQKTNRHTKKNLEVLKVPSLGEDQWFDIFVPRGQPNEISSESQNQIKA